jgi:LuxR family maltose regulon positive regulatory protein
MLPLLKTKIKRPPVRPDLLERSDLFRLLDQSTTVPLTIVSAPAGFGKSTLVCSWCEARMIPAAWFACDAGDTDPVRLLLYIVYAIRLVRPALLEHVEAVLQAPPVDMDTVLAEIIDELAELDQDLILVFDDVHLVADDLMVRLLSPLVSHTLPHVHIILIGRAEPSLPLARFRAQGRLAELRANDLRLAEDRVIELFQTALGLPLTEQQAHVLHEKTEGWLAGLHLAGLSLKGRSDKEAAVLALAESDQYILDYLLGDVLDGLSETLRRQLLRLSILERFTADLVGNVVGAPGDRVVAELERHNLFLVRLDHESQWYRFHHLFAELLERHLSRRYPVEVDEVLHAAGIWYARNGHASDAVRCMERLVPGPAMAAILSELWTSTLQDGEAATVLQSIVALPPMLRDRDIRIQMLFANVAFHTLRFELADEIHENLRTLVRDPDLDHTIRLYVEATIEALNARSETNVHGYADAVTHHQRAISLLSEIEPSEAATVGIGSEALRQAIFNHAIYVARNYHGLARVAQASDYLRSYRRNQVEPLPVEMESILEQDLLRGCILTGDIRAAMVHEKILTTMEQSGPLVMSGPHEVDYRTLQARMALDRGDIAMAEARLFDAYAIERRNRFVTRTRLFNAYMTELRMRLLLHDHERVDELLRTLDTLRFPTLVEYYKEVVESMNVFVKLIRGTMDAVERWMDSVQASRLIDWQAPTNQLLGRLTTLSLYAHAAVRMGRISLIDTVSNDVLAFARANQLERIEAEFLIIDAIAHDSTDGERALESTRLAIEIIERTDCIAPLYPCQDMLVDLKNIMRKVPLSPSADATIQRAFHVMTLERRDRPEVLSPSIADELEITSRELETLQLLARGLSNQKIADALFVSLATVKTHLYNLYQKLGVTNRAEAIIRAAELGLATQDSPRF